MKICGCCGHTAKPEATTCPMCGQGSWRTFEPFLSALAAEPKDESPASEKEPLPPVPEGQETFENGAAKFGPDDTFGTSGYDADTETRMRNLAAIQQANQSEPATPEPPPEDPTPDPPATEEPKPATPEPPPAAPKKRRKKKSSRSTKS